MDAKANKTIFLPWAITRAMLHLAAKKDVRTYINSVYAEANARETRLTATDGAVLGSYRQAMRGDLENDTGVVPVFRGIVPRAAIEELPEPRTSDRRVVLALTVGAGGLCQIDRGRPFALMDDAPYPDYRRLFHAVSASSAEPGQFNPELLLRFVKFAKNANFAGCKYPGIRHAGPSGGALVGFENCPEFVGMIQPYRIPEPDFKPRAWVLDDMHPADEPAQQAAA